MKQGKPRGAHQAAFELRQRVLISLNKLADRDTYHVGSDELHKIAEGLSPDSVASFLSCVVETESEQKSAVRKECVRVMGSLARLHDGALLAPHLPKMVASVVKRLKDPDSVVREACVDTMGVLALSLGGAHCDLVVLLRPLFEALGEQNKQLQMGSALCLARVIHGTRDPPVSLLQRMLVRTTKLLGNPHFLPKPAIIELNTSIIQAGGARTQSVLSAAMSGIQESLKSSDWLTRKAASVALGEMASSRGSLVGSFKASCVRSLESCRFDKVKPVRDAVSQSLQCWKTLAGTDTPDPSEAGSSIKENFSGGDYSDMTSASISGRKDTAFKRANTSSTKGRIPLSVRKKCQNYVENTRDHSKEDDWRVEIAIPKTLAMTFEELNNEESEGSSVTKNFERMSTDVTSIRELGYEYVHMDDRQECSSESNLAPNNFETKIVSVDHRDVEKRGIPKQKERDQLFLSEETFGEERVRKIQDRASIESSVTESASPTSHRCCVQMENEMVCIRKQLVQIQDKQSNLMELLQVFSTGIMDNLATLQSRVVRIEDVVDRLGKDIVNRNERSSLTSSKLSMPSHRLHSARNSTSTPRPSLDINNNNNKNRQPSLRSSKTSETWAENVFQRSPSISSGKQRSEMWADTNPRLSRNPVEMDRGRVRKDPLFGSASHVMPRKSGVESKHSIWKRVKGFVREGDLDSAYAEALCCGDELILLELFESTGPVLEYLSSTTISEVLGTLVSFFSERKYTTSVIPWMQQVVELSDMNGPKCLVLTAKARQKLLSALQDVLSTDFANPLEKRCVAQISVKLQHLWGNAS